MMQTVNEARRHLFNIQDDEESNAGSASIWFAKMALGRAKRHAELYGMDDDGNALEDEG